jgi:plasmid stabilization system protein ParE
MKVIWTPGAFADPDDILGYTGRHFPQSVAPLEQRVRTTIERLSQWPQSAKRFEGRSGVRVATPVRYPFRIFYRVADDHIEILHIRHAARKMWDDE